MWTPQSGPPTGPPIGHFWTPILHVSASLPYNIQTESPALPYESPNLPDKTNKST